MFEVDAVLSESYRPAPSLRSRLCLTPNPCSHHLFTPAPIQALIVLHTKGSTTLLLLPLPLPSVHLLLLSISIQPPIILPLHISLPRQTPLCNPDILPYVLH